MVLEKRWLFKEGDYVRTVLTHGTYVGGDLTSNTLRYLCG
jgi:hypothetical protein